VTHLISLYAGPVEEFAVGRMGARSWRGARLDPRPASSALPSAPQRIVLSPDADLPLKAPLDPGTAYIIGGLVDRTVQKGATKGLAESLGVPARRLPIAEHLQVGGPANQVLSIDQVFAALLAVHAGEGWEVVLRATVPLRKQTGMAARSDGGIDGNGEGAKVTKRVKADQ
jgi:hypothetical protein